LEGLMRVANRGIVLAQVIVSRATLTPSFSDPGRLVNEFGRQIDGSLVVLGLVQANDGSQGESLLATSDAAPEIANAVFGNGSHATVTVNQRPPHHGIRAVIAHEAEREHRATPSNAIARLRHSFESGAGVTTRNALNEVRRVLLIQILVVELDENRGTGR